MSRITRADFYQLHFTPYQWALLAFLLAFFKLVFVLDLFALRYFNTDFALTKLSRVAQLAIL